MTTDDREYHIERVRIELDQAYRAERSAVAEAHLKLSSLHMQRLQALGSEVASAGADQPAGAAQPAFNLSRKAWSKGSV
jgi:hypothetical protein